MIMPTTRFVAALFLIASTAFSAGAETGGGLPPGAPAGVKPAQLLTTGNVIVAGGILLVAGAVLSSGGSPTYADLPVDTAITTST